MNPAPDKKTQAERIFAKFGGARKLQASMKRAGFDRNISTIYRWNLAKANGGSGGVIPGPAWPEVLRTARLEGIVLTPEDAYPGVL